MVAATGPLGRRAGLPAAVLDLLLPASCASCRRPGAAPLCQPCVRAWDAVVWARPRVVAPDPCPAGLPPTVAAAPYDGVLRLALTAYKDEGRRDLAPLLGTLLAGPVGALAAAGVTLVPVPSSRASRRRRGDAPLGTLVRSALRVVPAPVAAGVQVVDALRVTRAVADQAGLGHAATATNTQGAFAVRPRASRLLLGRDVVLVDDVVTTGATLVEAARALAQAGCRPAAAAVVAATARRDGGRGNGGWTPDADGGAGRGTPPAPHPFPG